jgi:viroplasmin and RNaseH domain-containing protein
MGRNKGPKFYAVFRGRERGVFDTWGVAEKLVKGYPRAKHQSFTTRQDAEAWLRDEEAKEKGKARDHQGQDIAHAGGHGFIASARAHTYRNSRSHHGASADPRTYQNSGANSNPGTHYKPDANQQVRLPGSRAKWPGPAFAVFKGHNPGVYRNCADAEEQVEDFPEYEIQEFASRDEAWQWFQGRQAEEDSQNQKRKRSEHTREMAESSESATKRIRPSLNEQDFVPLDDGQSDFSDAYSDETSEDGISGPRRKSNRNNRVLEELPPLCAEQQDVVDLVVQRKNIFTTGSAGCGKSVRNNLFNTTHL